MKNVRAFNGCWIEQSRRRNNEAKLSTEEDVKGKGNTKNGSWVLDHCHETESFRGWLCHKCNRALGGFDDDIEMLLRAKKYLEVEHEKT